MSTIQRKERFVSFFLEKNNFNFNVLTKSAYLKLIDEVKAAYASKSKTQQQRRRVKRYDLVKENDNFRLIQSGTQENPSYVVPIEEVFDIIETAHISSGHGGRDRIRHCLQHKYHNITFDMISTFLNSCETCHAKKSVRSSGFVVKPIVEKSYLNRAQVDLIDMQSRPDGEFRWILVYQDHFTKRVSTKAIKRKSGLDVSEALIDIFAETGIPRLLHTDNGREFKNKHVRSLKEMFPGMDFVHGRPRHSQSQGSVERANQDIEKMLACWMRENNCSKWVFGN
jgi:hypothetical protein